MLEAADRIGGGTRSSELTLPGLLHDDCSAFHPMGVASPFLRSLDLAGTACAGAGRRSTWPIRSTAGGAAVADPLAGGRPRPPRRRRPGLAPAVRAAGRALRRAGRRRAAARSRTCPGIRFGSPASGCGRCCRPPCWPAGGGPTRRGRCSAAWRRTCAPAAPAAVRLGRADADRGRARPRLAGGRGRLAGDHRRAGRRCSASSGGTIETGVRSSRSTELPARRRGPARRGARPPPPTSWATGCRPGSRRAYRPLPARARRVQARPRGRGRHPVDQRGLPAGRDRPPGWDARGDRRGRGATSPPAGCRSGRSSSSDSSTWPTRPARPATCIRSGPTPTCRPATPATRPRRSSARSSASPRRAGPDPGPARPVDRELAAYNPNYVGGDIATGANDPPSSCCAPRLALDPYATGVPGVYLCSAATPPGAGVHGMCGYNAARSALRHLARPYSGSGAKPLLHRGLTRRSAARRGQPWRAFQRGLCLLITWTRPLRRTTTEPALAFRDRTELRTFIGSPLVSGAENTVSRSGIPRPVQVVHCWFGPPVQSQICSRVPSAELGPVASRHRPEPAFTSWVPLRVHDCAAGAVAVVELDLRPVRRCRRP